MSNLKLKITSAEVRKSDTKGDYLYAKGSLIKKDGTVLEGRTIMSFGDQFKSVRKFMRSGRTVTVSAVFEGGTIKVLGPQRVAAAA
jgi:hypothetical protein